MRAMLCTVGLCLAVGAAWGGPKEKLDNQIRDLMERLAVMQQDNENRIPPEKLAQAQGLILMERTKAGLVFAYQGGRGVAMVRDPKTRAWGPVAFVSAGEASLGFQIGGQHSFIVTLLMTTNATQVLAESSFEFGGEASGTAGDANASAAGSLTSAPAPVLVYAERAGLYGGASILGGSLSPDEKADRQYYGIPLTTEEILFERKVKPSDTAIQLGKMIDQLAQPAK